MRWWSIRSPATCAKSATRSSHAPTPSLMKLRGLQHLWTPVTGTLRPGFGLLEAIDRLHPTPAVLGFPKIAARNWLNGVEERRDGLYTGLAGWIDLDGDGEAAVVLRAAHVEGREAHLWAGAGIMAASDPDAEWAETELKMSALLDLLEGSGETIVSEAAALGFRWAGALLDGLAAAGLRRVVVSPGSRSTPLALAALRHPDLQVQMIVDERSAAFFALGLARAEGRPVALVATSGSAIANWLPAVVEADMSRMPLILLSADRPPELQDCGANQTMEQIGLFGGHVRAFHQLPPPEAETDWLAGFSARVMAASQAPLAGPVHVNLPLREPLTPPGNMSPTRSAPTPTWLPGKLHLDAAAQASIESLLVGKGAIICGPSDLGADFSSAVDQARRPAQRADFRRCLIGTALPGEGRRQRAGASRSTRPQRAAFRLGVAFWRDAGVPWDQRLAATQPERPANRRLGA